MTTIMVSGRTNKNVLLYHKFHLVSFHGSTSVPGLATPFWPVWYAKVPLIFMTQYLVWNDQEQKSGNKTAVDNVTSAGQLRNPTLISPAIEVINFRGEKFVIYWHRKYLLPLSVIIDGGIYSLGEMLYLFTVITVKIILLNSY